MRHSILKTLPSLLLLVGQIATAAVPGPSPSLPYDIDYQSADVDAQQTITYVENRQRADKVREAFRFAWSGYKNATWKNGNFTADEVRPTNNLKRNPRWVLHGLIVLKCVLYPPPFFP